MPDISAQIEELQTRLAFQDDTIAQLNDVVAAQQKELEKLSRALRSLSQQFQDWRDNSDGEPPPHY